MAPTSNLVTLVFRLLLVSSNGLSRENLLDLVSADDFDSLFAKAVKSRALINVEGYWTDNFR